MADGGADGFVIACQDAVLNAHMVMIRIQVQAIAAIEDDDALNQDAASGKIRGVGTVSDANAGEGKKVQSRQCQIGIEQTQSKQVQRSAGVERGRGGV